MEQLRNIEMWISDKPNKRGELCGVYEGPATERGKVYMHCAVPMVGSFVTLVKNTSGEIDSFVVCEVYVIGELQGTVTMLKIRTLETI